MCTQLKGGWFPIPCVAVWRVAVSRQYFAAVAERTTVEEPFPSGQSGARWVPAFKQHWQSKHQRRIALLRSEGDVEVSVEFCENMRHAPNAREENKRPSHSKLAGCKGDQAVDDVRAIQNQTCASMATYATTYV